MYLPTVFLLSAFFSFCCPLDLKAASFFSSDMKLENISKMSALKGMHLLENKEGYAEKS